MEVLIFSRYDEYKIVCSLHHGKEKIGDDIVTNTTNKRGLCDSLTWDQWSVKINYAPFRKEGHISLHMSVSRCVTICRGKGE